MSCGPLVTEDPRDLSGLGLSIEKGTRGGRERDLWGYMRGSLRS